MNLREQLLTENSKENIELVASWIGNNEERFQQLMDLFLFDKYRVVQRSAHALGKVGEKHPEMILPYIDAMLKRMSEPDIHVAVKRNVVRVLQYIDIPEKHHGDVMNLCFDLLADAKEAIAVRVFSMTVLDNLSKQYPEIKQELHAIVEDQLEQGCTAAFKARAKTILKNK